MKQSLKNSDELFLLIGMDAFADIAKWHQAEALFRECEFIVAGRPGYSLADVANSLPENLRPRAEVTKPFQKQAAHGDLVLPGVTIYLLEDLKQPASATAIRQAAAAGKPMGRFVDPPWRNTSRRLAFIGRRTEGSSSLRSESAPWADESSGYESSVTMENRANGWRHHRTCASNQQIHRRAFMAQEPLCYEDPNGGNKNSKRKDPFGGDDGQIAELAAAEAKNPASRQARGTSDACKLRYNGL